MGEFSIDKYTIAVFSKENEKNDIKPSQLMMFHLRKDIVNISPKKLYFRASVKDTGTQHSKLKGSTITIKTVEKVEKVGQLFQPKEE